MNVAQCREISVLLVFVYKNVGTSAQKHTKLEGVRESAYLRQVNF